MKLLASAAVIALGLAAPRAAVAATTYEIVAKVPTNRAFYVGIDPSLHRVYSPSSALWVIDGNTDSVIAELPAGASPSTVAVDPTTHAVFVGDETSKEVNVFDGAGLQLVATVPLAERPLIMAIDPSTHTLYVLGDGALNVIDGVANVVTDTRPMAGDYMAVDPNTHTLYVTNNDEDALLVVDGSTHDVVDVVPVASPYVLDIDPGLHTVYLGSPFTSSLSLVDTTTRAVSATVPLAMQVISIAVDPASHAVYVGGNGEHPAVDVVDGNTRGVVATFPDDQSPTGIAVDPVTHTAFVSNLGTDMWKILAFCSDPICVSTTLLRFGALVASGRGVRGFALALPLLIAGISESIGYQAGACRAMRLFTSEVASADGPFLSDVLATDWIDQAEAIEGAMGCP